MNGRVEMFMLSILTKNELRISLKSSDQSLSVYAIEYKQFHKRSDGDCAAYYVAWTLHDRVLQSKHVKSDRLWSVFVWIPKGTAFLFETLWVYHLRLCLIAENFQTLHLFLVYSQPILIDLCWSYLRTTSRKVLQQFNLWTI